MNNDKAITERVQQQIIRFGKKISKGLKKSRRKFVNQMIFGIQASRDIKLSNVCRSLNEEIRLIKTEQRLSRQISKEDLTEHMNKAILREGYRKITKDIVLAWDLSDIQKPFAKKMDHLAKVWDGSEGEVGQGYWINSVIAAGGSSVKKCYQCATCSVVCNLSPDDRPYPRKEMIWTQWGLKDRLMGDPDVWLCHWCNDCSVYCPRGVNPGDVMAAIRTYIIRSYAVPGFLGRMLTEAKYFPLLLAVPAALLAVLIYLTHNLKEGSAVLFSDFFPHIPLQIFFTLATGLAALGAIVGVMRFWGDLNRNSHPAQTSLISATVKFVKSLLTHEWFNDCEFGLCFHSIQ